MAPFIRTSETTFALVSLAVETVILGSRTAIKFRAYKRNTISQSYGPTAGFLISAFYPSTASEYERLERVVLRGSDDEALRFRASVTSECKMTAVAVGVLNRPKFDPVRSMRDICGLKYFTHRVLLSPRSLSRRFLWRT